MSIDLQKRAEHVGIILAKKQLHTPPKCRVGLCLDTSGSMQGLYKSGVVQETVDRLLAVAMKFDDNGEMDMWTFDNRSTRINPADAESYGKYVRQQILENSKVHKWGGTSYSPCFQDVIDYYYGAPAPLVEQKAQPTGFFAKLFSSKSEEPVEQAQPQGSTGDQNDPAVCLFITDGECDDESRAAAVLREAANRKIYWHMIGIGSPHHFRFLERQADLLPNVGFVNMSSLNMSDDELYTQLITDEFMTFVKSI